MHPFTKQELRKIYREKRINLTAQEFQSLNEQLMAQVMALDLRVHATIHLFLPIKGNHEPDTYAIAKWLRQEYPHMRLVLSRTERGTPGMRHFIWDNATVLTLNHWGIPEPESGTAVLPPEIDVVFVPLLAFDSHGHRVGYGKGYYDRFLGECRPTVRKIGLSLFEAETIIGDITVHDIALDACITPTRIWDFNTAP
ncbi:5-formyltetrahydrofolate cyclo-ligase [Parapedobacter pyrenivorans]|uniref:5-formyltetrahydrofolate cyclo-ligase n=1 Tax=Parapedobacter pyrenivorans TaxID=1305674 RepID=UPI00333E6FCA